MMHPCRSTVLSEGLQRDDALGTMKDTDEQARVPNCVKQYSNSSHASFVDMHLCRRSAAQ